MTTNRVLWLGVVATIVSGSVAFGATYIYPKKGQSKQRQDKDKGECTVWATDQTGFDPANPPPRPAAPQGGLGAVAAVDSATGFRSRSWKIRCASRQQAEPGLASVVCPEKHANSSKSRRPAPASRVVIPITSTCGTGHRPPLIAAAH